MPADIRLISQSAIWTGGGCNWLGNRPFCLQQSPVRRGTSGVAVALDESVPAGDGQPIERAVTRDGCMEGLELSLFVTVTADSDAEDLTPTDGRFVEVV